MSAESNFPIRPAQEGDHGRIDAIVAAAFASTRFGHQGEAALVRALRADGDALVDLVAEQDGALVGHALFSKMTVEADGQALRAAALAPVAVLPEQQSRGIGSALIDHGIAMLRAQGVEISFVLGHTDYYPRFGYRPEYAAPFACAYAGAHLMALWLDKAAQLPESGRADYAPAFSR